MKTITMRINEWTEEKHDNGTLPDTALSAFIAGAVDGIFVVGCICEVICLYTNIAEMITKIRK